MPMSLPPAIQTVDCIRPDLLKISVRIAPPATAPGPPSGHFTIVSSPDVTIDVKDYGDVYLNRESGCLTVKYRLVNQGSDPDLIFHPDSLRASDGEFGTPVLDSDNKGFSLHYNNDSWALAWPLWSHKYNIRAYDKDGKPYDADPVYHNKPPFTAILTIVLGIFVVVLALVGLNFNRVVNWLKSVR